MEALKRLYDPKTRTLLGLGLCLVMALLVHVTQTGERLSRRVLDKQFALLQRYDAHAVPNDVVVVGIDQAALKTIKEPFALWHPHLGKFLQAMAQAKPAVVGLDIMLPERSYQFLIPEYDQSLLQGLQALKGQVPVILAQSVDDNGAFREVYAPYVVAAGADALASVVICADEDGVVRRFDPNRCTVNAQGSTIVEKMAVHLPDAKIGTGLVDFSAGGKFEYVPFLKVLEWQAQGDTAQLARVFGGKPVLLGVVTGGGRRVDVPVPLAAWEPFSRHVPSVLMHAQMLRSMLEGGLIREANGVLVLGLALLAALFWMGRGSSWIKLTALLAFPFLLLVVSSWLFESGVFLPIGGILFSGIFAFGARLVYDGMQQARQRNWLRLAFGSYVSQEVLQEIMAGKIHSGLDSARTRVCVLFADIHGFSARSENDPPQEVVALLNDYFSEMTVAIHQHQGTVDKFIGDSIMAFFGAPQALECPEKNALEAAQEMLLRLKQVNARLQQQGLVPIEIGIALYVGGVVIGHIGPESRHEYTAVGDAVSRAAALEDLTKNIGYPVLCTADVAKAMENSGGLVDCGEHSVDGVALRVYGWNPPLLAVS